MTRLAPLALAAALLALPAAAQEADPGLGEALGESLGQQLDEGLTQLEEGAQGLLRGLVEEAEPAIEGLGAIADEWLPTFRLLADEMGPAFAEVIGQVDSIQNYEPPAILPNGDIVLRRRADAPAWTPPAAEDEAPADPQVDL